MAPQPLSKVAPNAIYDITTDALVDKQELSNLVTQIFAMWAAVEHEFQILFARIVGSENTVANAVYSALTSEALQRAALSAAAQAKFGADSEQFEVFSAVLAVIKRAGKLRHKLAHWRWGTCPATPDALLLADPADIKRVELGGNHKQFRRWNSDGEVHIITTSLLPPDRSKIFVYRPTDLREGLDMLAQANHALSQFEMYLFPSMTAARAAKLKQSDPDIHDEIEAGTSAAALSRLSISSLFREELDRIQQQRIARQPFSQPG